jgi:predicted CXXCH cytochrome family protein
VQRGVIVGGGIVTMVLFRALGVLISVHLALALATSARADDTAGFVGAQVCAGCHAAEAERWKNSHHARAMQKATEATVLGDFTGATFEHFGLVTTFSRAGDKFLVHTDGPAGALHDYEIAYTFGVYPLQQYLIAFPGGRYQALGIAWDSRPKEQGGQRWFHLYPGQKLPAGDRLHWTGRDQTWNYMCADCHSTGLTKNYDLNTDSYTTSWSDVDVACEACHGPGSRHVARMQAQAGQGAGPSSASEADRLGLVTWLKATDHGHWEMNAETGIARRTETLVSAELDVCAACHARRKVIAKNPVAGAKLLDSYLPALLEPDLYHADGQIDGEVYEYGSFLQSRMYRAGVTCSNCHEPHSLQLRAEGNALCAQCHLPAKFDVTEHTHHQSGSAGAQCANCHMPAKTYMVVHSRRDHSFRIPRPDLSASLSTPNACTQCHKERSADWAAQTVATWFPNGRQTRPHYGTAIHAGRIESVDAERQLDRLILDQNEPAIARASALLLLPAIASSASVPVIKAAISDPSPLVRMAAPRALPVPTPQTIVEFAAPLLSDPVRAVRIEAARALAEVDPQKMTPAQQNAFGAAYLELVTAEMVDADRPEAHLNLALLDVRRRQPAEADAEYRTALRLDPTFVPALVNLADLDRMRGMDQQGAELLRKAMSIDPNNASIRHSLGLLRVRQHKYAEALALLRQASELAPGNARYAYVYAVALNATGAPGQAMALLERTHQEHPADRDVLIALVSIARDSGNLATALRHARELLALYPEDMQLRMLVLDLEKRQSR